MEQFTGCNHATKQIYQRFIFQACELILCVALRNQVVGLAHKDHDYAQEINCTVIIYVRLQ